MPPDIPPTLPLVNRIVRRWVILGIVVVVPFELTLYAPGTHNQWLDLPSHFAVQYLIGALAFLAAGRFARFGRRLWCAAVLALLLALPPLLPYLPLAPKQAPQPALKLLQANVLFLNKDPARFRHLIEAEQPDIILIAEANNAFAKMLDGLRKDYPFQQILPDDVAADGIGVASRMKLQHLQTLHWNNADMPALRVAVEWQSHPLTIIAIHTPNPLNDIDGRDATFEDLQKEVATRRPLVIAGDFNAAPWCPALRALTAQLHNARGGRGLFLSWPTFLPFFMRIPIDETLVSKDVTVQDYRLGPDIGSDHLPIISALSVAEAK